VLLTVSLVPTEPVRQSKYDSFQVYTATHKTDEQKKEEVATVHIGIVFVECNKKAQLTQGLCATARHSKMAISRHLGYY